jgi:uncharacterized membrane protein YuzA (DUF378 family)
MSDTLIIALALAAFPALIVVAAVFKYMEVMRAAGWPKAQGRIITSTSEARTVRTGGPNTVDTERRTFAKIVYEFTVAGRKYRGGRVSIGEDLGNFQVAETIAKYPVGKEVTVYYNPVKPSECVLERDVPPELWKGFALILAVVIGLIVVGVVAFYKLGDIVTLLAGNTANPQFVAACVGFALLASLIIWAIQRHAARQRTWPKAPAVIEHSDVRAFEELEGNSGSGRWRTVYRADIIYRYDVGGVRYTGDMVSGGMRVSSNIESVARKAAAKYPAGMRLDIRYNPDNPAESVLKPMGQWVLLLWLIPASVLLLAYFAGR